MGGGVDGLVLQLLGILIRDPVRRGQLLPEQRRHVADGDAVLGGGDEAAALSRDAVARQLGRLALDKLGQLNAEKKYLDESYQELIDSYSEGESPIADDSEYIYAIRDAMSGEPEKDVFPATGTVDEDSMLHVRLLSATYPGLTYIVVYYRSLDGNDYLYDYGSKLSYKCPLSVALRLWEYLA